MKKKVNLKTSNNLEIDYTKKAKSRVRKITTDDGCGCNTSIKKDGKKKSVKKKSLKKKSVRKQKSSSSSPKKICEGLDKILLSKYNYDVNEKDDKKRRVCLSNAFIVYGAKELVDEIDNLIRKNETNNCTFFSSYFITKLSGPIKFKMDNP